MKKVAHLILFFSVSIFIGSCDNEPYEGDLYFPESNENPNIPEDFQNTFHAQLNGQDFNEQHIYTIYTEGEATSDFIAITGSENNYHSIIVYLPSTISPGIYYFDPQSVISVPNLNITYSNLQNLLESGIGDGVIYIDEHDILSHYIKGRFECVVNSQNGSIQNITEGSFEVVYEH